MWDKIKSFCYDFLSIFVVKRVKYNITGKCNKCGKCCQDIRFRGDESDFNLTKFLLPTYKRFRINGKDEDGYLILGCTLQNSDGTCSVYEKRPSLCRNFPKKYLYYNAVLQDGCGYTVEPDKKFEDYFNNYKK